MWLQLTELDVRGERAKVLVNLAKVDHVNEGEHMRYLEDRRIVRTPCTVLSTDQRLLHVVEDMASIARAVDARLP